MTPDSLPTFLAQADAGTPVPDLAASFKLSESTVYALLRSHRPGRARSARRRTSPKRAMVLGLLAAKIEPVRVALLCECTRQWVHKISSEAKEAGQ